MIYHEDCNAQDYCVTFYKDYIQIDIINIPKDEHNRSELLSNISIYFTIENTIVKYKDNVFHTKEELKIFLESFN